MSNIRFINFYQCVSHVLVSAEHIKHVNSVEFFKFAVPTIYDKKNQKILLKVYCFHLKSLVF
jgi:hypothetical protein